MKAFAYIFKIFSVIAIIGIALGAYWHIYTAAACWLLASTIKKNGNK